MTTEKKHNNKTDISSKTAYVEKNVSAERVQWLENKKKNKLSIKLYQWGILVGFFIFWEFFAVIGVIDDFLLSKPSRIISTLANTAQNGLLIHVGVTIYETLAGFILGALFGVVIAILLWYSEFAGKVAEPYLVVLNSLPKIALGPVIILIAGAGTGAIIVMALAISLIVTVLEMLAGFKSTDKESIKMAKTFGATKIQVLLKIVLPANVPVLFNSLKINIGLSLVGVIAGEFLVSKSGLGYLIVYGGQVFQMDLVMCSVLILALLAAIMYQCVNIAQHYVQKRFKA